MKHEKQAAMSFTISLGYSYFSLGKEKKKKKKRGRNGASDPREPRTARALVSTVLLSQWLICPC